MARQYVELLEAVCVKDTPNAMLIAIDNVELWIPRSQVHSSSQVHAAGDQGPLIVTKWVAEQKEIEFDEEDVKDEDDL